MPFLRREVNSNYTSVHNDFIKDKSLSLTAKGLLLLMISLPNDWNFSIAGLATLVPDGKDKIGTTLKSLEKAGYLRRKKICSGNGRFFDWEYAFSDAPVYLDNDDDNTQTEDEVTFSVPFTEEPSEDKPHTDIPYMEQPYTENTADNKILSKQVLKNKIKKNKMSCNGRTEDVGNEKSKVIISFLNEKAHTHYRDDNKETIRLINALLNNGYTVDDLKLVIKRKCNEWLHTENAKYIRPHTLFGEKFESYLNAPTDHICTNNSETPPAFNYDTDINELFADFMEA